MLFKRFTPHWQDEDEAKAAFVAHNEAVRATIPKERLVEWQPGDGWEPICNALGPARARRAVPAREHHGRLPHDDRDGALTALEAGRGLEAFEQLRRRRTLRTPTASTRPHTNRSRSDAVAAHRHVALLVHPFGAEARRSPKRHDPLAAARSCRCSAGARSRRCPRADRGPEREHAEALVDAVGGERRVDRRGHRPRRAAASHRWTATSWAWRRNQNRAVWSSVNVHIGVAGSVARERGDERGRLLAEPGDQLGPGGADGQRAAGDPLGRALLDHDARPLLDLADVGDEVARRVHSGHDGTGASRPARSAASASATDSVGDDVEVLVELHAPALYGDDRLAADRRRCSPACSRACSPRTR